MGRSRSRKSKSPHSESIRRSGREVKSAPNYADDFEENDDSVSVAAGSAESKDNDYDVDIGMVSDDPDDNFLNVEDNGLSDTSQTSQDFLSVPKAHKRHKKRKQEVFSDDDEASDHSTGSRSSARVRSKPTAKRIKIINPTKKTKSSVQESDDEITDAKKPARSAADSGEELSDDDESREEEVVEEEEEELLEDFEEENENENENEIEISDENEGFGSDLDENILPVDEEDGDFSTDKRHDVQHFREQRRTRRGEVDPNDLFSLPLDTSSTSKTHEQLATEKAQRARKRALFLKKQKDEELAATIQSLLKISERTDDEDLARERFHSLPDPHIRYTDRCEATMLSVSVLSVAPEEGSDDSNNDCKDDQTEPVEPDVVDESVMFYSLKAPTPPPPRVCLASNTCTNPRKYTTAQNNVPVCSLACYKIAIS